LLNTSGRLDRSEIAVRAFFTDNYQLYGFYDVGVVWNQDAVTSQKKRESLASAGIGARANVTDALDANVSVAVPLTRDVETQSDSDPRFYFSLNHSF
jgi:hemolysin activation/secretion protein